MGANVEPVECAEDGSNNESLCASVKNQKLDSLHKSNFSLESSDNEAGLSVCRVCHCRQSDRRGDAALGFLDISPPAQEALQTSNLPCKILENVEKDVLPTKNCGKESGFIEFISPEGEVFVCSTDLESGSYLQDDPLINLGCSCKNDLALAHYACALKWFINHGSSMCEICGTIAKNVRLADIKKVMISLKDYESLKERTATGEVTHVHTETDSDVDPDAIAAIRRQRLSEVSSWFNPHNNSTSGPQEATDRLPNNVPTGNVVAVESPASRWAVEGAGILVATGLLTVTLAWLLAPHVGKTTARNGLHILLGGICAMTVVIFLRFVILSKLKQGPARYWAILFVFWFLVFGIWASRAHGARTTS